MGDVGVIHKVLTQEQCQQFVVTAENLVKTNPRSLSMWGHEKNAKTAGNYNAKMVLTWDGIHPQPSYHGIGESVVLSHIIDIFFFIS